MGDDVVRRSWRDMRPIPAVVAEAVHAGKLDVQNAAGPLPARDVRPGECWAFRDHRTLAEIWAGDEGQS